MKKLTFTIVFLFGCFLLFSQQWEQLTGEPEGGGLTDIIIDESTGDLFVTAGSLDWPGGEDGGIRRSSDDGNTWTNLFDAYTSRFIMKGPDDNLYASVWDYPADEGLYRSTDDGNSWTQLTSVPDGNNIFACAIVEASPNIIFAGTGQGVYRSFDNGTNWAYANNGLPVDKLVRSMAVSPDGNTIAAGTVSGLYVSSDNGDNWDKVTGDGEDEIVTSILFDVEPTKNNKSGVKLYFGTESGKVLMTTVATQFTVATFMATIMTAGVTRIMAHRHPTTLIPIFMASMWAATGGGFFYSVLSLTLWQSLMNGLPTNPKISMFTSTLVVSTAIIVLYLAMYGNSKAVTSGCEIYKANFDIATSVEGQPYNNQGFELHQNFPNPFKNQTWINFRLPESEQTSLKVFDLAGKEIRSIIDETLSAGKHSINVTKEGLSSGIYYYVLQSGNLVQTKKLVIQ